MESKVSSLKQVRERKRDMREMVFYYKNEAVSPKIETNVKNERAALRERGRGIYR
jgi:hypothetical protein